MNRYGSISALLYSHRDVDFVIDVPQLDAVAQFGVDRSCVGAMVALLS